MVIKKCGSVISLETEGGGPGHLLEIKEWGSVVLVEKEKGVHDVSDEILCFIALHKPGALWVHPPSPTCFLVTTHFIHLPLFPYFTLQLWIWMIAPPSGCSVGLFFLIIWSCRGAKTHHTHKHTGLISQNTQSICVCKSLRATGTNAT